jgi:hypothetical protein
VAAKSVRGIVISALFCCVLALLAWAQSGYSSQRPPRSGFAPDTTTAVAVAEAVLIPIYGRKQIDDKRPLKVRLEGSTWIITATLHCGPGEPICPGGTAEVKLSKQSGAILFLTHYQ